MTTLGTPLSPSATKVMLLGSGELGKEVLIALQRLGVETIAVDRYDHALWRFMDQLAHDLTLAAQGRVLADAPHLRCRPCCPLLPPLRPPLPLLWLCCATGPRSRSCDRRSMGTR